MGGYHLSVQEERPRLPPTNSVLGLPLLPPFPPPHPPPPSRPSHSLAPDSQDLLRALAFVTVSPAAGAWICADPSAGTPVAPICIFSSPHSSAGQETESAPMEERPALSNQLAFDCRFFMTSVPPQAVRARGESLSSRSSLDPAHPQRPVTSE